MTTGRHCISYIACVGCEERLGWKYASITLVLVLLLISREK